MSESHVPAALLSAVKRDLRPVRPLASAARRALALAPLGLLMLLGIPMFWIRYGHITALAPWPWWGLSPLETVAGLLILAAAFREAIPGRELSTITLTNLVGGAVAGFLFINLASALPANVEPETAMRWLWECIGMAATFSVPSLAVPAWLVSRALPNRPALTGALCGLGIGLMADAGLRWLCWNGTGSHVLLAHGGAIAILMALGAASATIVERIKAR